MNLNQREHCLSLLYIAVLRVKTLARLMFKSPFNYNRFIGINTVASNDQELDHVRKIAQII
jgi:hypothetical protein